MLNFSLYGSLEFESLIEIQKHDHASNISLNLSCLILKNDQINFQNVTVLTPQDFLSVFDYFSTLYMKGLNIPSRHMASFQRL